MQSDVEAVAVRMRDELQARAGNVLVVAAALPHADVGHGSVAATHGHGWLASNPLGAPTEREVWVAAGGRPVWRLLLTKLAEPGGAVANG